MREKLPDPPNFGTDISKRNKTHFMKKVNGIGGIFFKCQDPQKVKDWYAQNLGIAGDQYGTNFEWLHADDPTKKGTTVWAPFAGDTKYFDPSTKEFMINYTVEDLEALVVDLKKAGVTILDEMAVYDYGKFIHILDPEGNKIELWQPIDNG
jgi:predicted enzyme related to lactoylglutathione lyase